MIGDMMALDNLPGVAQVAIQGAKYAAKEIRNRIGNKPPQKPFKYFDKGSMATISRFSAVVLIGRLRISGFVAWLMWLGLHLVYLTGFKNRVTALGHWLVSFLGTRPPGAGHHRAADLRPAGDEPDRRRRHGAGVLAGRVERRPRRAGGAGRRGGPPHRQHERGVHKEPASA